MDETPARDTETPECVRENIGAATENILDSDFATLGELREAFDD